MTFTWLEVTLYFLIAVTLIVLLMVGLKHMVLLLRNWVRPHEVMPTYEFYPETKVVDFDEESWTLSEVCKQYLRAMGWHEHRQVDTDQVLVSLKQHGFIMNEQAVLFLQEFGGLAGVIPALKVIGKQDSIDFRVENAANSTHAGWANEVYAPCMNESLCLIGEAYSAHFQLYIAESGKMFGGNDGVFIHLGNNGYQGLNTIFEHKKAPEIAVFID